MRGAARSLLVNPWFAAGTGFVIATGLWIYSPHTELRFPDSAPGYSLCQSKGCVSDSPGGDGGGHLTASGAGKQQITGSQARTGRMAKTDVATSPAVAGLKFRFTILWQQGEDFDAYITVSGHPVPGSWRLSFAIPGVRIDYVVGVSWRPARSRDGGTASALTFQYGNGGDGGGSGSGGTGGTAVGGHDGLPVISFSVTGAGAVGTPTSCTFDGSTCRFH
jgi:hypothetical protein